MRQTVLFSIFLLIGISLLPDQAEAQRGRRSRRSKDIVFDQVYNNPSEVKRLFLGLMPAYADMFTTNVNLGVGVDAHIFPKKLGVGGLQNENKKYSLHFHARTTYASQTDLNRFLHSENTAAFTANEFGSPGWYVYAEGGYAYHFYDNVAEDNIKLPVTSTRRDLKKAASEVNDIFEVTVDKRTLVTARAGLLGYRSAVNWNNVVSRDNRRVMRGMYDADPEDAIEPVSIRYDSLGIRNEAEGLGLRNYAFGDVIVGSVYLGASMSWIWNAGFETEGHADVVRDAMVTGYADFMVAPFVVVGEVKSYNGKFVASPNDLADFRNRFGGRIGLDIAHNRAFGWGLNAEIGYRPGIHRNGAYFMMGFRFPVFATDMNNLRESFQK